MDLGAEGARKYGLRDVLASSRDLSWQGLAAGLRRHPAGELPAFQPTHLEIGIAVACQNQSVDVMTINRPDDLGDELLRMAASSLLAKIRAPTSTGRLLADSVSLAITEDNLDDEALAQHDFVSHGHEIVLHVPSDAGDEVQAALPERLEQFVADIASASAIAKEDTSRSRRPPMRSGDHPGKISQPTVARV